jgi:hypothetical protein
MPLSPNLRILGEVRDPSGDHRLVLQYVERPFPNLEPPGKAYDFHSLEWSTRVADAWVEQLVITREDFLREGPRRWIIGLHSLDPAAGVAIIKIGEERARDDGGIHIEYSWRTWNLVENRQLAMLRVCAGPFEPFEVDR